jgi:hypothetical protein
MPHLNKLNFFSMPVERAHHAIDAIPGVPVNPADAPIIEALD